MNVAFLLDRLLANRVDLIVDNESLRLRARRGTLTPELLEIVRTHKSELIKEFAEVSSLRNPRSSANELGFPRQDTSDCTRSALRDHDETGPINSPTWGFVGADTIWRRVRGDQADLAEPEDVVRAWVYLKHIELRTIVARDLPRHKRDGRLTRIRFGLDWCRDNIRRLQPDKTLTVVQVEAEASDLHGRRLEALTKRRAWRKHSRPPRHRRLTSEDLGRREALVEKVGLDRNHASGQVGAVLDEFANHHVEVLGVTKEGEPTWVDRHFFAGDPSKLRGDLCEGWRQAFKQCVRKGMSRDEAEDEAWRRVSAGTIETAPDLPVSDEQTLVRTTMSTRWNDPEARRLHDIPADTVGQLIDIDTWPMPYTECAQLKQSRARMRERGQDGAIVVLEGYARILETDVYEEIH